MNFFQNVSPLWLIFGMIVAAASMAFLLRGYRERRRAIQLRRQGFVSRSELLESVQADRTVPVDAPPSPHFRAPFHPRRRHGKASQGRSPALFGRSASAETSGPGPDFLSGRVAVHDADFGGGITGHHGANHHRPCPPKIPGPPGFLLPFGERAGPDINGRAAVEILEGDVQSRLQRQSSDDSDPGDGQGDDGIFGSPERSCAKAGCVSNEGLDG